MTFWKSQPYIGHLLISNWQCKNDETTNKKWQGWITGLKWCGQNSEPKMMRYDCNNSICSCSYSFHDDDEKQWVVTSHMSHKLKWYVKGRRIRDWFPRRFVKDMRTLWDMEEEGWSVRIWRKKDDQSGYGGRRTTGQDMEEEGWLVRTLRKKDDRSGHGRRSLRMIGQDIEEEGWSVRTWRKKDDRSGHGGRRMIGQDIEKEGWSVRTWRKKDNWSGHGGRRMIGQGMEEEG